MFSLCFAAAGERKGVSKILKIYVRIIFLTNCGFHVKPRAEIGEDSPISI